jgi:hypothetical protein
LSHWLPLKPPAAGTRNENRNDVRSGQATPTRPFAIEQLSWLRVLMRGKGNFARPCVEFLTRNWRQSLLLDQPAAMTDGSVSAPRVPTDRIGARGRCQTRIVSLYSADNASLVVLEVPGCRKYRYMLPTETGSRRSYMYKLPLKAFCPRRSIQADKGGSQGP